MSGPFPTVDDVVAGIGAGGGGAATWLPSISADVSGTALQSSAPVSVSFNVSAVDEDGVRRFFSTHRRALAEETARAVQQAQATS